MFNWKLSSNKLKKPLDAVWFIELQLPNGKKATTFSDNLFEYVVALDHLQGLKVRAGEVSEY